MREQGQKVIFCGTTLFAAKRSRSVRCQHTGCPLTLAMRRKILKDVLVPLALGGPFAESLFAPLSAIAELSVDALSALLPPLRFQTMICLLNTMCVHLSSTFFRTAWTASFFRKPDGISPFDKKGLNFPQAFAIIPSQPQDSYIGNTTASQAVKAGSTPVSCSKKLPNP